MPSWLLTLLQLLPNIVAEITAIVQSIQGTPTPAQAAQLKALASVHSSLAHAVSTHVDSLV